MQADGSPRSPKTRLDRHSGGGHPPNPCERGRFVRCSLNPEGFGASSDSSPTLVDYAVTLRLTQLNRRLSLRACEGSTQHEEILLLCGLLALVSIPSAAATQFLYANNATFRVPSIYQIDPATGNVPQTFTTCKAATVAVWLMSTTSSITPLHPQETSTRTTL